MLRSLKHLQGSKIVATDGDIGHVEEFYFDDERWVIRYLVVDTTAWRLGPQVLVSPIAVRETNWTTRTVSLSITRDQVKHGPLVDTQKPVSRQHEREFLRYYHYPHYWGSAGLWGTGMTPGDLAMPIQRDVEQQATWDAEADDAHLRSSREVLGYHIQAADGQLGHLSDFLVDDRTWAIRYAVVDTSNWWFGKHVLLASEWITDVHWSDSTVSVELTRQAVKDAPTYDPDVQIDDQWERDYLAHYQQYGQFQTRATASPGFVSLKAHDEFKVATTDRDPRGWKVVSGADGRTIGKVDDLIADPATMKVRYLDVDLESSVREARQSERGGHILLPVAYAQLSPREDRVTAEGLSVDDVGRLPAFEALPVSPEYDDRFRELLRHAPVSSAAYSDDGWSVAKREHREG